MHRFQHLIVDMLDRHVEIRADPGIALHDGDQFIVDLIRIEIEEAEPEILFHFQHFSEQLSQSAFFFPVFAEIAEVLRDQNHFENALR